MSTQSDTRAARVLCLDQPGPAAERLVEALAQHGFQTELCGSAQAAQTLLDSRPPGHFQLVLAEVTCGGLELLDSKLETPLLLLDSFGTLEQAAEARQAGAAGVLARPLTADVLAEACARAVRRTRLAQENARLRGGGHFGGLASRDARMLAVLDLAERVADSRAGLLFQGESGTGKTRLARAVHRASSRRERAFIEVNCGALPGDLLMSELFGHVRGAFTGAESDRIGKFEAAHGGTLFLDEIATASPDMQVKLLRVLESGQLERVGSNRTVNVDVRVLAACNLDLQEQVKAGRFRADLFWRLNVVAIELPPLRERPGDLIDLAAIFLERFAHEYGRELGPLDALCQALLLAHDWPGNVRELENTLERAVLFSRGAALQPEDFGPLLAAFDGAPPVAPTERALPPELRALLEADPGPLKAALAEPEAYLVRRALEASGGNRRRTAAILDINRSTLFNKMRRYGLSDFPTRSDSPTMAPADAIHRGTR